MSLRTIAIGIALLLPLIPAQTPPAITRGPYLQLGTPTSVVVRWRTDPAQTGRLWWGTSPTSLTNQIDTTPSGPLGIEHSAHVTGLQPGTRYYYAIGLPGFSSFSAAWLHNTVLAGGDQEHSFVTQPAVGDRQPFRAWVLGDSGTANADAAAVRDAFHDWSIGREPDLWLMLGDNAYVWGSDAEYQAAVFDMFPSTLRRSVLWPAFGNHDAGNAVPSTQTGVYFELFELPTMAEAGGMASGTEAYYSFDHGNVHFVCLDSQGSDRTAAGPMGTWLQADLQSTNQDWIVAFWHHPPYSKGSHNSDLEIELIEMRAELLPILEAHGVDLVLSGHSHGYERSMLLNGHYGYSTTFDPTTMAPDPGNGAITGTGGYQKPSIGPAANEGTVYVVNGASGSLSYAGLLDHPVMVANIRRMGSLVLDVNGLQMDLQYLGQDGAVEDSFTLTKGGVTPIRTRGAFIDGSAPWKFDDTGTDLGTAWRDPLYDDSTWLAGNPILGFGEPYISTPISFGPDPNNVHPTTYFRQDFMVDVDPMSITSLRLSVGYDDAYVAYLNGQEIARRNLPTGTVAFTSLALTAHEPTRYEAFDITYALPILQQGSNLIAIEVHQAAPTSDDLIFDAWLTWEGADVALDPACATGILGDVLTVNGSAGGIGRSINVTVGQDISIAIQPPPGLGPFADFALLCHLGSSTGLTPFPIAGGGALCFTPTLGAVNPSFFTLAASVPIPGTVFPSGPAPWNFVYQFGIPIPGLEVLIQPALTSVGSSLWKSGNAIRVISVL